jgi:ATP-dependent DNA helicase PIF1
MSIDSLPLDNRLYLNASGVHEGPARSSEFVLHEIIMDAGIDKNEDQERTFRIVGEHFVTGDRNQLLLHISGIRGSGKSHVINAICTLFKKMDRADKLQVTAPTGCAAVLIRGHTIHSLTFLPKGRGQVNQTDLEDIWKNIAYLIIDKISLVSARLLSDVSQQLCLTKSADHETATKPFSGINVVMTGDFGQLKPVKDQALFSYQLVGRLQPNVVDMVAGQSALHGAYLWRQVNKVVELRQNWCAHTDPAFVALLGCVRLGNAWDSSQENKGERNDGVDYSESDYIILNKQRIQYLAVHSPSQVAEFQSTPVLVAEKSVRDAINLKKACAYAKAKGTEIHAYLSRDLFKKVNLPEHVQVHLWSLNSNKTEDSLGSLPLFLGMPVIVTENLALSNGVVNGVEGKVHSIKYTKDARGRRFATCAYVTVPGSCMRAVDEHEDLVPILPASCTFKYEDPQGAKYSISHSQLPLLPTFAFTNYKVQGRSLERVVVDLVSCRSLQSVYMMLSWAKSLDSLAILRWFPPRKIFQRLLQDFRDEFARLQALDLQTQEQYNINHSQSSTSRSDN